jgi:hypothetical protein
MEALAQSIHTVLPGIENAADLEVMGLLFIGILLSFIVAKVKGVEFF